MERLSVPERPDWREKAEGVGFGFHEMYGEPYWLDGAAYAFSLDEIESRLEDPSAELHQMCLDLVDEVSGSDELMRRLDIPAASHDLVRASWENGDLNLYGRFDLAYDGTGPAKLLEYNADTPTAVFEAAVFQHGWMEDQRDAGRLAADVDQLNSIHETLIECFAALSTDRIFHFACATENDEDRGTTTYLMDCAAQAGHRVEMLDIADIGLDDENRFTDAHSESGPGASDRVIERCFKLYPWEDMLREPFAAHIPPGLFFEPPWKAILSNKGMLPLLWERHEGHPNLLECYFADDDRAGEIMNAVIKPFFSREGENVAMIENGRTVEEAGGDYSDAPMIVQSYAPLFRADTADGEVHAVCGTWIVGDKACGLGMREDKGRITRDLSRFVPHVILG